MTSSIRSVFCQAGCGWRRAIASSASLTARAAAAHPARTAASRGAGPCRSYAAASKPMTKRPAPAAAVSETRPDRHPPFELSVRLLQQAMAGEGEDVWQHSAEEYYNCIAAFQKSAREAPGSTAAISGYTPAMLHESACLLRRVEPADGESTAFLMWTSAAHAGLDVAALTLVRFLMQRGEYGKRPKHRRVENQFQELVRRGKDPNALTIQGELLFRQKEYAKASRVLERALQHEAAPSFQWRPIGQLLLAMAYQELGQTDQARALYEAAREAGLPDAAVRLGLLARPDDPDRAHELLYEAACRQRPQLFSHLAEIELERLADASDAKAAEEHQRWAAEWSRLADKRVAY